MGDPSTMNKINARRILSEISKSLKNMSVEETVEIFGDDLVATNAVVSVPPRTTVEDLLQHFVRVHAVVDATLCDYNEETGSMDIDLVLRPDVRIRLHVDISPAVPVLVSATPDATVGAEWCVALRAIDIPILRWMWSKDEHGQWLFVADVDEITRLGPLVFAKKLFEAVKEGNLSFGVDPWRVQFVWAEAFDRLIPHQEKHK